MSATLPEVEGKTALVIPANLSVHVTALEHLAPTPVILPCESEESDGGDSESEFSNGAEGRSVHWGEGGPAEVYDAGDKPVIALPWSSPIASSSREDSQIQGHRWVEASRRQICSSSPL